MNERLDLVLSLEIFRVGDLAPSPDRLVTTGMFRVLYIPQASFFCLFVLIYFERERGSRRGRETGE